MGSLQFLSLTISQSRFIPFPNSLIGRNVNSAQFDDHDTFFSSSYFGSSPKISKKLHTLTNSLFPAHSKEQIKGNKYVYIWFWFGFDLLASNSFRQMKSFLQTILFPFKKQRYSSRVIGNLKNNNVTWKDFLVLLVCALSLTKISSSNCKYNLFRINKSEKQ